MSHNITRGSLKHKHIPSLTVEADTVAEAWHAAMCAVYKFGLRIETPKQRPKMALGYDADTTIVVVDPLKEPRMHKWGIYDDARGIVQYTLEVTHGIHNHWKKDPKDKNSPYWGYTYNERFIPQIPHVLARIKHDWIEKGRVTGRDYQWGIWRYDEDAPLYQEDPPCWQRGNIRLLPTDTDALVLQYFTEWRSRDLAKAWLENVIAQIELQKLLASCIHDMLGVPVIIGPYVDHSTSLHIYGKYIEEEGMEGMLEKMEIARMRTEYSEFFIDLHKYLGEKEGIVGHKKLIAAQAAAEKAGKGKNLPDSSLKKNGFDPDKQKYPKDWDTYPDTWRLPEDFGKKST